MNEYWENNVSKPLMADLFHCAVHMLSRLVPYSYMYISIQNLPSHNLSWLVIVYVVYVSTSCCCKDTVHTHMNAVSPHFGQFTFRQYHFVNIHGNGN